MTKRVSVGFLFVSLACLVASPAAAGDWDWSISPYLWAADISMDLRVNDRDLGRDVAFADLLDKVEATAMVQVEGRTGRTGFLVNALYLSVSDTSTTPRGTAIASDLDTLIVDAAARWQPLPGLPQLDLLFGVRALDLDQSSTIAREFEPPSRASIDKTFTDAMVGLRYTVTIADPWALRLRGDTGFGDTEENWNLVGLATFRFGASDRYAFGAGYRIMKLGLEGGTDSVDTTTDLELSGPIVSFTFGF